MEDFLLSLPETLRQVKTSDQEITVILGNESCDLDSAVCAIVLAHHLNSNNSRVVIPVLNIPKDDVPLRTEVIHTVGKNLLSHVPTQDDIQLATISFLNLILVDHHVLLDAHAAFNDRIVEIIDHRELNEKACFPSACKTKIEMVGSCATLVAQKMMAEGYNDELGLKLLRNTIVTDTENLNPVIKKATTLDISILEQIENTLTKPLPSRSAVFEEIRSAKVSIEGFTTQQLLRKDLKLISFKKGTLAAVPSTLVLASSICKREGENAVVLFEQFCEKYGAQVLIIIGLCQDDRDMLFYCPQSNFEKGTLLINRFTHALLNHPEVNVSPTANFDETFPRCVHFVRNNRTYTRKKILPIIQSVEDVY